MSGKRVNVPGFIDECLNEALEKLGEVDGGSSILEKITSFCSNPAEYTWRCLGRQDIMVPYCVGPLQNMCALQSPLSERLRWEQRDVWMVEGKLHPGESNILARRRFYIDPDSWLILLGEGYDHSGAMSHHYMVVRDAASIAMPQGQWYSTKAPL